MEDLFKVGVITSTHGVKGEVKVFPTTDDVQRFKKLKEVILNTGKAQKTVKIQGVKFFKQFVILKFEEINSMNEAETYRGGELFVTRENAVKLKKDEYFIADLIGLQVVSEDETLKGILKDVMETGANDVYVIGLEDGRELLLPAIKECILKVDMERRQMTVHVLDGLLE